MIQWTNFVPAGNAGNVLDGHNPPTKKKSRSDSSSEESASDDELEDSAVSSSVSMEPPKWQSATTPMKPATRDRCYYHLPYYEDKPCLYIKEHFEDHRRRLYNTNIIDRVAEKLVSFAGSNDILLNLNET